MRRGREFLPADGVRALTSRDAARHAEWVGEPSVVAADGACRRLHVQLIHWGVDDDVTEEALLVVTELLANVVDHARTPFVLSVRLRGPLLRVSVSDTRTGVPEFRPVNLAAGRVSGLRMVSALATRWGWQEDGTGKTVWAEFLA